LVQYVVGSPSPGVVEGDSHAEATRFLGVNVRSVRRRVAGDHRHGDEGLDATPHPGRLPRSPRSRSGSPSVGSARAPTEFGFPTELWAAPRIAQVIGRTYGITFHPRYHNAWPADLTSPFFAEAQVP
jgi:hypothetical protein